MSFEQVLAEDRRIAILLSLNESPDRRVNEMVLRSMLGDLGHTVSREMVRADLAFLREHQLVRIETRDLPTGPLQIAELLSGGEDVAKGRRHPGIARAPAR